MTKREKADFESKLRGGMDALEAAIFRSSVNSMMELAHLNAVNHGFYPHGQNRNFGECIALTHGELSEAMESFRKHGDCSEPDHHCPEHPNVAVELGDAIIRIFDLAKYHDLDLAEAILAKHRYNLSRPLKHGKKF